MFQSLRVWRSGRVYISIVQTGWWASINRSSLQTTLHVTYRTCQTKCQLKPYNSAPPSSKIDATIMMKAAVIYEPGGPEVLKLETIPVPKPNNDEVLIRIKAFGLNRSELF